MKIDLKELKAIFGDKLPSRESFMANNEGHNVSMLAIIKHVGGKKLPFYKVWDLFVADFDAFIASEKPKKEVKKVVEPVVKEETNDNKDS